MKKGLLFLFFFLCSPILNALVVSSVSVQKNQNATSILLDTDIPVLVNTEKLDDQTYVVHFPVTTIWKAPRAEVFGHFVKSFTYVPYDDGTGDLVFKVERGVHQLVPKRTKNGKLDLVFQTKDTPQEIDSSLLVTDIQIGQKNGNTRLVIDLSEKVDFTLKKNPEGSKIILIPNRIPQWKTRQSFSSSIGRFKGYTVHASSQESALEISTIPGTKVSDIGLIKDASGSAKLVVDLGIDLEKNTIDPELANQAPIENEPEDILPQGEIPNLVKKFDIITDRDDTVIRLETKSNRNFPITTDNYTNTITIHLPKTNDIKLPPPQGLINAMVVDQTSSTKTDLVLSVQKKTTVTGKKVFNQNTTSPRFILYLNQNAAKTPSWLVEQTVEKTSYNQNDLDFVETTKLTHKGGLSPYATIGEGVYFGLQADQISSENTSESINSNQQARKLSGNNFGGGGHAYVGYGLLWDKLYSGFEFRIGGYGADEKTSYQSGATLNDSVGQIGFNWDVSTRLGAYISATSLLYARLGVSSANFTYSGSSSANGQFIFPGKFSKNSRTGFVFGAGLETALNDQLSLRLEGTQTTYQGIRYIGTTASKKDRAILNQTSLGLSYKPSPIAGPALTRDELDESTPDGPYFGLEAGLGNMMNRREVQNSTGPAFYKGQSGTNEPVWGAFAGYSYEVNRFFLAAEAQVSLNSLLIQENLSTNGGLTGSYSNRLKWLWALTARPGFVINHGTRAYGRLGLVGGTLTHKNQANTVTFSSNPSTTKRIMGVRSGGGLEVFVNPQVSVRADYTMDYFPRISFKDSTLEEKIKILNNEFKLGVAYTLPPF